MRGQPMHKACLGLSMDWNDKVVFRMDRSTVHSEPADRCKESICVLFEKGMHVFKVMESN